MGAPDPGDVDGLTPASTSYDWHNRLARLGGERASGHLLLEALTCYGHGPDPITELEWTVRLDTHGQVTYEGGMREDWSQALEELTGGVCPWLDPQPRLIWMPSGARTDDLRRRLFDSP